MSRYLLESSRSFCTRSRQKGTGRNV